MSYSPTLEDTLAIDNGAHENSVEEPVAQKINGSYQPTLEDTLQADQSNQMNGQQGKNQIPNMMYKMYTEQSAPTNAQSHISKAADILGIPDYVRKDIKDVGGFAALEATGGIPGIAGLMTRLGIGSGLGALENPKNRMEGAETGAGFSALGEALPGALSGVGKIAELINPIKYAGKLGKQIQDTYQTFKGQASGIYNDLKDRYVNSNIYEIGDKLPSTKFFQSSPEDIKKLLSNSTLEQMTKDFIKKPTYNAAHDLQAQMGSYMREIRQGKMDANDINTLASIKNVQRNLQEDIGTFLKNSDKLDYAKYQEARAMTRNVIAPHESNDYLKKVSRGKIQNIQPADLSKAIKKTQESGNLPEGHYLNQINEDLQNRIKRGQAINDLGSLIGGGAIGEALMPGLYGVGSGLGLGAAAAKYVNPTAIRLAQNPYFLKGLQKMGAGYNFGRSYLLNETLKNQ